MSRLLLQNAVNATSALPAPPTSTSKSGMIYTFAFIGATLVIGLAFLGIMFKYVLKYRHWRAPITDPLQPGAAKQDDYKPEVPHIKEIVVISNPDGVPSISIVREAEMSDERPPFITYETMISKKVLDNYSQKYLAVPTSMQHAASASDLAGMGALHCKTIEKASPSKIDEEDSA